jgi:hypothetical protein
MTTLFRFSRANLPNISILILSVFIGILIAFIAAVNPRLLGVFSLSIGVLTGLLSVSWFFFINRRLPFGEAAGKTYNIFGARYRQWFAFLGLASICGLSILSGLVLTIMGRDQFFIAVFAGLAASASYCWFSLFSSLYHRNTGTPYLSLGWIDSEIPKLKDSLWNYIEQIFLLPFRSAWYFDSSRERMLEIHHAIEALKSPQGMVWTVSWDMKKIPFYSLVLKENIARVPFLAIIFLLTLIIALWIPFYQVPAYLPPELAWMKNPSPGLTGSGLRSNSQNENGSDQSRGNGSSAGNSGGNSTNTGNENGGNSGENGDNRSQSSSTGSGSGTANANKNGQGSSSESQGSSGSDGSSNQGSEKQSGGQQNQAESQNNKNNGSSNGSQNSGGSGDSSQDQQSAENQGAKDQSKSNNGGGSDSQDSSNAGNASQDSSGSSQQSNDRSGQGQKQAEGNNGDQNQSQNGSGPGNTSPNSLGNDQEKNGNGLGESSQTDSSSPQKNSGEEKSSQNSGGSKKNDAQGSGGEGDTGDGTPDTKGPSTSDGDQIQAPPAPHENSYPPPTPGDIITINLPDGGPLYGQSGLSPTPTAQPGITTSPYQSPIDSNGKSNATASENALFQWIPNWIKFLFH